MTRPPDTRLTPEVAQEICERTGSTAVLEGSITSLGSQYVLWLRARNCHTGDILGQEQGQAGKKEDVLKLSRGSRIKSARGWAKRSPPSESTPLLWSRQPRPRLKR